MKIVRKTDGRTAEKRRHIKAGVAEWTLPPVSTRIFEGSIPSVSTNTK